MPPLRGFRAAYSVLVYKEIYLVERDLLIDGVQPFYADGTLGIISISRVLPEPVRVPKDLQGEALTAVRIGRGIRKRIQRDRIVTVAEVAEAMRIPKSFLSKIVQRLAKHGIVESSRGVNGGLRLAKSPSELNLLSILEAIQGIAAINLCVAGRGSCGLSPACAVRPIWVEIRHEVEKRLREQTLEGMRGQFPKQATLEIGPD